MYLRWVLTNKQKKIRKKLKENFHPVSYRRNKQDLNPYSVVRIRGSESVLKCYGSRTLLKSLVQTECGSKTMLYVKKVISELATRKKPESVTDTIRIVTICKRTNAFGAILWVITLDIEFIFGQILIIATTGLHPRIITVNRLKKTRTHALIFFLRISKKLDLTDQFCLSASAFRLGKSVKKQTKLYSPNICKI